MPFFNIKMGLFFNCERARSILWTVLIINPSMNNSGLVRFFAKHNRRCETLHES